MADSYYIRLWEGAVPQGPFSRAVLFEMAERGELPSDTLCLREEQGNWVSLSYVLNPPACPHSYKVWSYITAVCCFPFSLVAVRQSSLVRPLYDQGKYAEAKAASRSALRWNILFMLLLIGLLVATWQAVTLAFCLWQAARG